MTTSDIILLSVTIVLAAIAFYIHLRNSKVARFRMQIIKEDYDQSMANLDKGIFEEVNNYSKLPSYDRMIFSFKPLEKKYWL
jgi:hypothetical protein